MAIPLLGIASGAVKIGQKLFSGIAKRKETVASGAVKIGQKLFSGIAKRKEKKAAKRAAKTAQEQAKLDSFRNLLGGAVSGTVPAPTSAGSDAISQSGNGLLSLLGGGGGNIPATVADDREEIRAQRVNQMMGGPGGGGWVVLVGIGAAILFLFSMLKGRRR